MTTINQLSPVDSLAAGDQVPVFAVSQGDARKFSLSVLVTYLSSAFASLTATSFIKVSPVNVANLPAATTANQGARAFVTDATSTTFAADPVGGGANAVPVYCTGSAWKIG